MPPPAAAACRAPRRPRRRRARCGRPGRPASTPPAARGRSHAPTAHPRSRARSASASDARGTAHRSRSSRPGTWLFSVSPVPASRSAAAARAAAHPPGDHRGGLRLPEPVQPGGTGDRRQVHPQVDAVEQRARQPGPVAAALERAAGAGGVAGGAGARTGVGGQDQLRPAREGGRAGGPVDGDLPALQRLTQRVEHRPGELGRLVEEEHAAVRPAQRTRPDLPGPAADQRRHRRRVVRRLERRAGDQRRARRQGAGDRVDGGDLERRLLVQRRQQPRQPLGEHRLARARADRPGTGGARRRRRPRPRAAPTPARPRRRGRGPAAAAGTAAARRAAASTRDRRGASTHLGQRARRPAPRCPRRARPRRRWRPARRPGRDRRAPRPAPPAALPRMRTDRAVEPQFAEQHQLVDRLRAGTVPAAASTATASARSKPLPCLGIDAGESPMVIAGAGEAPRRRWSPPPGPGRPTAAPRRRAARRATTRGGPGRCPARPRPGHPARPTRPTDQVRASVTGTPPAGG